MTDEGRIRIDKNRTGTNEKMNTRNIAGTIVKTIYHSTNHNKSFLRGCSVSALRSRVTKLAGKSPSPRWLLPFHQLGSLLSCTTTDKKKNKSGYLWTDSRRHTQRDTITSYFNGRYVWKRKNVSLGFFPPSFPKLTCY